MIPSNKMQMLYRKRMEEDYLGCFEKHSLVYVRAQVNKLRISQRR